MAPSLVYLEWVDSTELGNGRWIGADDWQDETLATCRSVGFLLKETDDTVFLACALSDEEFGGVWLIPKCAIRKRSLLTEPSGQL